MNYSLSQPGRRRGRTLLIIALGMVAVVAALVAYAYYVGMPLAFVGAQLVGSERGSIFAPLVSHARAGGPCFDIGTQDCERAGSGEKQTVGFLFYQSPAGIPADPLYVCPESNAAGAKYILTTTHTECRNRKTTPHQFGYVAKTDAFENSTPLIYCEGSGEVVPEIEACTGTARQLGYMTAAVGPTLTTACKGPISSGR